MTQQLPILDLLSQKFPECSRNTLRTWLQRDRVEVDGTVVSYAKELVDDSAQIKVTQGERPAGQGAKIIFEDQDLLVAYKPPGLLTVATEKQKYRTLFQVLKNHYWPHKVHVVHRLDRGTSGLILFAKKPWVKDALKKLLETHSIEREYFAVVEGKPESSFGTWESYLVEDANHRVWSTKNREKGKRAVTHYELVGTRGDLSALKLRLETGRKNQIRVHCFDQGHSISGDKKYGAEKSPFRRLALHAYRLSFVHPVTGKALTFESPIPQDFGKF